MKNFIFKSSDADLQKMFQLLFTIQKNVLYVTHQVDYIRKQVDKLQTDKALDKQVMGYYEEEDAEQVTDQGFVHHDKMDLD